MKKEKLICFECGKEFDELVTREIYIHGYAVEWVCEDCFEVLEGCRFSEYKREVICE